MEFGTLTFRQIFKELSQNKTAFEDGYLYLKEDEITLDSEIYFGEPTIINEKTDEEFVPEKISELGFDFGYLSDFIQDVYENLSYRKATFDETDYLKAFNHYIDYDAFISDELLNK